MEIFTCVISMTSIIISIITILYTRKELNWQMEQARRAALFQCIDAIAEYNHKLSVAKRLRGKTGEVITLDEKNLIDDLEEMGGVLASIASGYRRRLDGVGGRLSDSDHQNAMAVSSQAREHIMMFDEWCERFEGSRMARQAELTKAVGGLAELAKKILRGRDLAN